MHLIYQKKTLHMLLTSILLFQMPLTQQNQTDFERKYSDLAGSLAENYSEGII